MALRREITRVYLDTNREGTITCIACGVKRTINMSTYGDDIGGKTLNAQCRTCTAVFRATFDFRRHCRVHVYLPGRLLQLRTREEVEPIVVTSLSVTGLGFVTAPGAAVRVGDKYEVVFVLDDADRSVLFEEIVITRVRGTRVGAAFAPSRYTNHDLIFFMMSEMSGS
jgi:uncharacterized C2H2 Zn-finger protein